MRGDDVADVLVELEPDELGARVHLVAVHSGRERGLLELLLHRLRLQPVEPGRPHEPARVHEPRQLVAREEHLLQLRVARHREVLGVREDGLDQLLGVARVAQDRSAILRMLVERGVDLVVEVVQESRRTPEVLVLAVERRVVPDGGLDRERVPQQRLALRVLRQRLPRLLASRLHGRVR